MCYIDYGASIFRKEALRMVPDSRFYPLEGLFPRLIAEGELLAFPVEKRFYEIGTLSGLKEFRQYIKELR